MYNETVTTHFRSPRHVGELPDPDAIGTAGVPGRSNYFVMHLRVRGDRICDIGFLAFGCPASVASASMLAEMAQGLPLAEAAKITAAQVLAQLGGLPPGKRHCPARAVKALRAALNAAADADTTPT